MDKNKSKILVEKWCLFDNVFMSLAFENNIEATQLLVRIITGRKDLIVTEVKSQYTMHTLDGKDPVLDIFAHDSTGKPIDIEFQRRSDGANPKRARYYSAVIDTKSLKEGDDYNKLPDSYVIFITENDIFKKHRAIYGIKRTLDESNEPFGDGSHIIYVNGKYDGKDDIGLLISDLFQSDPNKMHYNELKERVAYLKQKDGEEIIKMTQAEEFIAEEKAESRAEGIAEGIAEGEAKGEAKAYSAVFAELSKIGMDAKQLEALKAKFAVK